MNNNPFKPNIRYENDPEGLVIPYKWITKTDKEVLEDRYQKLTKGSYSYIVRLGIRVY